MELPSVSNYESESDEEQLDIEALRKQRKALAGAEANLWKETEITQDGGVSEAEDVVELHSECADVDAMDHDHAKDVSLWLDAGGQNEPEDDAEDISTGLVMGEDSAATRMQAARRGQLDRREMKVQMAAATRVQAARRGQQSRLRGVQRDAAAARVQAARRGQQGRRHARAEWEAAVKEDDAILARMREEAERAADCDEPVRSAYDHDEDTAAARLQAARRGQLERREIQVQATAATRVQAAQRGKLERREIQVQATAATRVQAAQRGKLERREVKVQATAAMREQAADRVEDGQRSVGAIETRRNLAAARVQAARRGQQGRRQVSGKREAAVLEDAAILARMREEAERAAEEDAAILARMREEAERAAEEELASSANAAREEAQRALEQAASTAKRAAAAAEAKLVAAEARAREAESANVGLREEVARLQQQLEKARSRHGQLSEPTERDGPQQSAARGEKLRQGRDAGVKPQAGGDVANKALIRAAAEREKAATERAVSAEEYARGLAERLQSAESNVKMLRAQLHQKALEGQMPAPRALGAPVSLRKQPGRRYAPAKLPKIDTAATDPPRAHDENQKAEESRQHRKPKKPEFDLRLLEAGFDTSAFPNYGGVSRSGLKARPRIGPVASE